MRLVFKAMILLGIFIPMQVFALGLGELHTHSYLNQPFDADLPLTTNNPSELNGLKVSLASPADFSRAGIDRLPILDALHFKVEKKHGKSYVHITSSEVIREPYLNFLVEVDWSRGRLLREFTVLLDPPDLLGGEAANVESPGASETPPVATKTSPAKPKPTRRPSRNLGSRTKASEKGFPLVYGPVKANEKLWNIARKMRGDIPATVPQVMMALLRSNPDAFIDDNVNLVKSGSVLRIQDLKQIDAMGPAQARKEFRHQYQLWLDYKLRRAAAAKQRTREASRQRHRAGHAAGSETRQQKPKEGVLTLERPRGEKPVGGSLESESVGKGKESEELKRLQQQLAAAQESAQTNQKQNEAMHDRLKAMEDQIAALQRLMSLRSDELTSLQQKLATQGQNPPASAGGKPEPGFFASLAAMLKKNPQTMGIVGGAILLLLLTMWLLMRRRKQAAENRFYSRERVVTPGGFDMPMDEPWGTAEEDTADHWDVPPATSSTTTTLDEDPVTQADIFVAYGNLDAAIDVMETAVNKWPDKGDYQRKLAELKDKRAAAHIEAPVEEGLMPSEVQDSTQIASSMPLKDDETGALLTDEDLLAFEDAQSAETTPSADDSLLTDDDLLDFDAVSQTETPLPAEVSEDALLNDDDMLAFDGGSAAEVTEPGSDDSLLTDEDLLAFEEASQTETPLPAEASEDVQLDNDDLLAFEEATQMESPVADEISEEALLTNDDLLAFEEEPKTEAAKPAEPEHDDIRSAISDFGFDLGEDLDLHEPPPASRNKPQGDDGEGLEFDLSDIHSELEQLTVDEGNVSASEHERSIPEFDLQDLEGEFGLEETPDAPAPEPVPAADEDAMEGLLPEVAGEIDEDAEIDLDLELPDEEPLGFEEDLDFDADSLIELPDHEPDLLNDVDEVGTKLDLARAYIDMGDPEGARSILDEVLHEGNSHQIQDANKLLAQIQ